MIYGAPGDRNIERLLLLLRRTPVVAVPGGGHRLQQPVHVEDLTSTVVTTLSSDVSVRKVYDLAGPEPLSFRQLLLEAGAAVGRRPLLVPVPLRPTVWGLRLYEMAAKKPRIKAEQLQRLAEDKAFDIGPAIRDLRYCPRPFAPGVRQEVAALWG